MAAVSHFVPSSLAVLPDAALSPAPCNMADVFLTLHLPFWNANSCLCLESLHQTNRILPTLGGECVS